MVQSLTQVGTSMYEQAGAAGADMSDNGASPMALLALKMRRQSTPSSARSAARSGV